MRCAVSETMRRAAPERMYHYIVRGAHFAVVIVRGERAPTARVVAEEEGVAGL